MTLAPSNLQTQKVNNLPAAMSRLQDSKKDVRKCNGNLTKMGSPPSPYTTAMITELAVLKLTNFTNGQLPRMIQAKEMMPSSLNPTRTSSIGSNLLA